MAPRYWGIVAPETGERFHVVACPGCGLGRTWPRPTDLAPYYGPAYYGRRHGITARWCVRRRLGLLRRWAGSGAGRVLLDYGSGDGDFARAALAGGWRGFGVERHQPETGPEDDSIVADLDDLPGDLPPIAAATFWHVLEHLDDPGATLARLRPHLDPDARVIVAVPDFASRQATVTGAGWLHLDIPRHLWHFTAPSLTRIFAASGYRVVAVRRGEWEYDAIGWAQGLLNRYLGGRNEFFQAVSGRPASDHGWRRRGQVAAGLGLLALASGPAWVEARLGRFGRAGTLIVVARPDGAAPA